MPNLAPLVERLRSSLWFVPTVFALGAFGAAAITLTVDRELEQVGGAFRFGGTAEGARGVLDTIAQSMLTFTALVFTITMLVLQLASSQLSPRVMRTFLRDIGNQVVLGLFVATFLFTLLVLRDIRSPDAGGEFVPGLSIYVAFALLVASVAAFIYYINHMAQAIRATTVMDSIAHETRTAIDRLFPETLGAEPEQDPSPEVPDTGRKGFVVQSKSSGNLLNVDEEGLLETSREEQLFIELVPRIGDFVPEGAPLFRVVRDGETEADPDHVAGRLRRQVGFGSERSPHQDAAFGFRQLVDIGLRALSPGVNDPSTAVQAVDRLHDLLRRLATRAFPSEVRLDDGGRPRLLLPRPEWPDYVHLAVEELSLAGADQPQMMDRLHAMLEDLATIAPPGRQHVIQQLERRPRRRREQ